MTFSRGTEEGDNPALPQEYNFPYIFRRCPREEFNGSSTSLSGEMVGGDASKTSKDAITCYHAGAVQLGGHHILVALWGER